ncbi:MAG TPA: phytanoyl-CoA dioxygenase family protein [Tepidisphaeraceae bacterium]|nr:phytanoyl-CoA dioxygenase family protein [Tepidisphaeraceae bacterium]
MDSVTANILQSIAAQGYAIVHDIVSSDVLARLISETTSDSSGGDARARNSSVYASRNLLGLPIIRELARSTELRQLVEPVLGPSARPVRGILFDKTPSANWKVAWHQDLSIAVKRRIDVPGFGPWSVKAGTQHVQPPVEVLRDMLTVRLHLDDCGEDNGPLVVLPGSHVDGVLSPQRVCQWRERVAPACCLCGAGGVVLMRPLILHASSSARMPGHRRVVHIEYAGGKLEGGMEWNEG